MKTFKEFQNILEAYKDPDLPKMQNQMLRHAKKASAVHGKYSHSMNIPPSATDRIKKHQERASKIHGEMQKYKQKKPEVYDLYKSLGMIK